MLSNSENTEEKTDIMAKDDIDKPCTPINTDGDSQAQPSETVDTSPELGLITTPYESPLRLSNCILSEVYYLPCAPTEGYLNHRSVEIKYLSNIWKSGIGGS